MFAPGGAISIAEPLPSPDSDDAAGLLPSLASIPPPAIAPLFFGPCGPPCYSWRPLTPISRTGHAAVFDPASGRLVSYGGMADHTYFRDLMWLDLDGGRDWHDVRTTGTPPYWKQGAIAALDRAGRRMVVFGGHVEVDAWPNGTGCGNPPELSVLDLDRFAWSELPAPGERPPGRRVHGMMLDPPRNRLIVYGGRRDDSPNGYCVSTPLTDLWAYRFDELRWIPLAATGEAPPPGSIGTALYDSLRDRMVFVSGDSAWALSLGAEPRWTPLAISGTPPVGAGPAVLDAAFDRVIELAGGEVWELRLEGTPRWTRLSLSGSTLVPNPAWPVAWDPVGRRILLHGGESEWSCGPRRTFVLDLGRAPLAWSEVAIALPPRLYLHRIVHDAARDRFVSIGGYQQPLLARAFIRDAPGAWAPLGAAAEPMPYVQPNAVVDAARDRVLVFGDLRTGGTWDERVWEFSLARSEWRALPGTASPRIGRSGVTGVLDGRRDRLLVFGDASADPETSAVWTLALDGSSEWVKLEVAGERPERRSQADAVYDSLRDRMIVVAGFGPGVRFQDVWALELSGSPRWRKLAATGADLGDFATTVLDPVRDRLVRYSGSSPGGSVPAGFDLQRASPYWYELPPEWNRDWFEPWPPDRFGGAVAYDPVRDGLLIHGGMFYSATSSCRDSPHHITEHLDTWWLEWGTPVRWARMDIRPGGIKGGVAAGSRGLLPIAILSDAGFDAAAIDPASASLVVLGAAVRSHALAGDVARLRDVDRDGRADLVFQVPLEPLAITAADSALELRARLPGDRLVRARDRVVVLPAGTWAADAVAAGVAASERDGAERLDVLFVAAGPDATLRIRCSLPGRERARIEVLDVSGRRIASRDLEAPEPGVHDVALRLAAGRSGVYFVRLRQGGSSTARKAVLVH